VIEALRWPSPTWALGVAALFLIQQPSAAAQQPTSADVESLIKKGSDLRRQGKDQLALPYYQRAYEVSPTGRTASQLGLCEMQLGYFPASAEHLHRALASDRDPWVDKYRAVLEQSFREVKTHITEVIVGGSPEGAEVSLDQKVVGHLPLSSPLVVIAGAPQRISVRASGYEDGGESVTGRGGDQIRVVLHLARKTRPASGSSGNAEANAQTDSTRADSRLPSVPTSSLRVAAWSTSVAALAFAVGGVVEFAVAAEKRTKFQTTPAPAGNGKSCGTDQFQYGGGPCVGLHDDWSRARTFGFVGVIGAGVLAVSAVGLFVLSSRTGDHEPKLACSPSLGGGGIVCAGHF
jgi:hypothetical protein